MNLRRTTQVSLNATAERYIEFARFCYDCRVSPRELAEVVQLADKIRKTKNFDAKQSLAIEIIVRLRQARFTQIQIFNDKQDLDIKMCHPSRKDEFLRLPIDKF
jgi:hypothetical protein